MIENNRHPSFVLLSLTLLSSLVLSCDKHQEPNVGLNNHRQNQSTPVERYDAYFTWKDDDGHEGDRDRAVFIWNGEIVGRGKTGFSEIVSRLKGLPQRSIVLEYPNYLPGKYSGPPPDMPFDFRELLVLFNERRLILNISCYDHHGLYVGFSRNSKKIDFSGGKFRETNY
jgi:hypothetical protein